MMTVLGFCEGVHPNRGGVGLVGVPLIHRALAGRGWRDALVVAGSATRSAPPMMRRNLNEVLGNGAATGAVGIVSFPAIGGWGFSPALYRAAVRHARLADFIMLHSLFSFPVLAGYACARRHRTPYGLWPHGVLAPLQRQIGRHKKAVYSAVAARRMLDNASVLFYTAEGEREEAAALRLKAPSVVIPHGIDTTVFSASEPRGAFRQKYLGGHAGPLVFYVGRLNVKKGLDLLVSAMTRVIAEVPEARLVIAGAGHPPSFASDVKLWIDRAGLAGVAVMTGVLDEPDKLAAFADCAVFVLPSAAENFGFAMFEAMASGRAVICSGSLNYADEVQRAEAGLLVRRTSSDIAEAIIALLRDRPRRERMGENGRRLAEGYSWDLCGERLEAAILSVLLKQPFSPDLRPASAAPF